MALPVDDTQDTPAPAFTWGANGGRMTADQIAARRKVADALMAEGSNAGAFPVGTRGAGIWTQGLARLAKGVSAGLDYREADQADKANAADNKAMIAALLGGGAAAPASVASTGTVPAAVSAAPASPDTTGKIYENDEPSPLDPPSGQDRARMIATILGEAGNEPQIGKNAVASVIRTRAVDGGYGGDTPSAVVTAPNQFEPWNTAEGRARMASAAANPALAAQADAAIRSAYGEGGKAPEDPTEGMTHFYSPAGQAALGRAPPAWAGGDSVTIGGHVFNSPDDAAQSKPVQVASAAPAAFAAPAATTPGVAAVTAAAQGQPTPAAAPAAPTPGVARVSGAINPAVLQAVTSPYADAATKQIGGLLLAQQMKPQVGAPYKDADGNLVQKGPDGTVHMLSAAEKSPGSVREYEYYKDHPTPGQPVMDYGTWATTKAREAATESPNATHNLTPGGELWHKDKDGNIVIDHKNDKSVNAEDVPQTTIDFLADRVRMGDPGVKIGYARNPGMIAKIDTTAQQREEAGIPVSDAARNVTGNKVTLSARGSAERKLGTINTNNEFYGNNALGALDIAEKASADVPRTDYPSVNKALNAYRTQTGDPKTVALGAALNTVVNDYAKFTGGGIGTDSLRGHAEEILNGAHSPEQLSAIVHMMRMEIKRGQQSPSMVREGFDSLYAPHGTAAVPQAAPGVVAAPAAAAAAPAAPQENDIAHNPQTGETIIRKNGKWEPLS